MVSLVFLSGIGDYIASGPSDTETVGVLQKYFGALDTTMLSLFMSVSGGIDWEVLSGALMQVNSMYGFLFVAFIASMQLAALNIIAGIFVNDSIEVAQSDRDIVFQKESADHTTLVSELKTMFTEIDVKNCGSLAPQEFVEAFQNPEMQSRFAHIGVHRMDADNLFDMLDLNDDGVVEMKEFVAVCLRLKDLTRPVDYLDFQQQNKKTHERFRRLQAKLDHQQGKREGTKEKSRTAPQSKSRMCY